MKKLFLKFFAIILTLILVISNFSILSLASKVTKEEYLVPYISMFEEKVKESGIDVQIYDMDLFYESCKALSLPEYKNRLDERFEEFKQIIDMLENNDEPFVLQDDNYTRFRPPYDSDIIDGGIPGVSSNGLNGDVLEVPSNGFDGGVPGVSSNDYESSNGLRRFPSSEDGSGFIFLESLSD